MDGTGCVWEVKGVRGHFDFTGHLERKSLESVPLHHCPQSALPAGDWHGPSVPPELGYCPASGRQEQTTIVCWGQAFVLATAVRESRRKEKGGAEEKNKNKNLRGSKSVTNL